MEKVEESRGMNEQELEQRELVLPISGRKAVIREGDGYSDRALFRNNKRAFEALYNYLAPLVVSIDDDKRVSAATIKDLLVPDSEFLAIECYKLNYGEELEFSFVCQTCGQSSDHAASLTELEMRKISAQAVGVTDPAIKLTLPRSRKVAEVGILNGHQECELAGQQALGTVDPNRAAFLALRSLDGSRDFSYEDVVNLPLADHKAIRNARKKLICGYETVLRVICPECGSQIRFEFLISRDFLLPGG
jgi:hypothetical protein